MAIGARARRHAQERERARIEEQASAERLIDLEHARAAAGSALRVVTEYLFARGIQSTVALLDVSGAMVVMERVPVPLGLPANDTRWIGAFALGGMVAILPAWTARSLEEWRASSHSNDVEVRRTAATRRSHVVSVSIALLAAALAIVALIAYSRATSPPGLSGPSFAGSVLVIEPLSWQALIALGLIGIAVTFGLEWYLAGRRGALDAHFAVFACTANLRRARRRLSETDRRLHEDGAAWARLRTSERTLLHDLSARNRTLHDAWEAGAAQLTDAIEPIRRVATVLEPAPIRDGVGADARQLVRDLEHAAALLIWTVDPFAIVLPDRDPPPVLAAAREMVGVPEVRGG